jgi:hypothetical protein
MAYFVLCVAQFKQNDDEHEHPQNDLHPSERTMSRERTEDDQPRADSQRKMKTKNNFGVNLNRKATLLINATQSNSSLPRNTPDPTQLHSGTYFPAFRHTHPPSESIFFPRGKYTFSTGALGIQRTCNPLHRRRQNNSINNR